MPTTESTDHYEVLGVPRTATPGEIKAAYFRLIRIHTPERDPERFRLISLAHAVLSNPEKRRAFDKEERLPPGVEEQLRDALKRLDEDAQDGTRRLERLAQAHPRLRRIRFSTGVALDRIGALDRAIPVFRQLFDESPDDSTYATWLGDALVKHGLHADGERILKQAIVLDRNNRDAYFCLARHHSEQGAHAKAVEVLDRGLHADGALDTKDVPLFIQKIMIVAKVKDWKCLESTATELAGVVGDTDEAARAYVLGELRPLLKLFHECKRPDLTHYMVGLMSRIDPSDQELAKFAASLKGEADMYRASDALFADASVADWIKAFVATWMVDDEEKRKNAFANLAFMSIQRGSDAMSAEWYRAGQRHPAVAKELTPVWRAILEVAPSVAQAARPKSGCVLVLVLLSAAAVAGALIT